MHIRISLTSCSILALFLLGCGSVDSTPNAKTAFKTATDHDISSTSYVIDPPDEILIRSLNVKELDGQKQKVRSDGKISLNLIGEVKVSGLTPAQAQEALIARAAKYYASPDIKVEVLADSKFYMIFGAGANAGGKKAYTGNDSLIRALAEAGMNVNAWPEKVRLVRPSRLDRAPAVAIIDFQNMVDTGDFSQNYALEPGDLVYIQEGPLSKLNRDVTKLVGPITAASVVPVR